MWVTGSPNWEADDLTAFMEAAHRNRFSTFVHKKEWFQRLIDIDGCFMTVAKDWLNPDNVLTPLFFLRSHAAFRAACEHATSGQVSETYPEIRICLEYAGYCLHIHKNAGLDKIWLRRHDNEYALKAVKNNFKISAIHNTIKGSNRHAAEVFDKIYQNTIDFGAHPNERAITSSSQIIKGEDKRKIVQMYLHSNGVEHDLSLKTTAQAGICALEILQSVFSARFALLGVREKILELRRTL
jgi:hypothetical protein